MAKNMFAGIEDTEREGAQKGEWFRDGDYIVEVQKFLAFESENPDTEGDPIVIVEGKILEVVNDLGNSNQAGRTTSWFNSPTRNSKGKLSQKGEYAMGRIKNFAAAALGGVPDEAITADVVLGLTAADAKAGVGPGEALAGIRLLAIARTKTSKKSGKDFTTVTWQPIE